MEAAYRASWFLFMTTSPSVYGQNSTQDVSTKDSAANQITYIDILADLLTCDSVLPAVEEVALAVLPCVHQHPTQELLLEVSLLSSHAHVVQGRGQSAFDESLQDVAD